jgi:ribosomal subunit interface protein
MINFKATNVHINDALKSLAEQKLQSLDKYLHNSSVICDVEFEQVAKHQHGNLFRIEVNLEIDGKLYRAEATLDSFEKAIDEVRNELDTEVRRDKGKKEALLKRGARKIKEMLRFGN